MFTAAISDQNDNNDLISEMDYSANETQSESTLKSLLEKVIREKDETTQQNYKWLDDGSVEVSCLSGMCIHSFTLEAEKLGKEISFEKKTIIRIAG